MADLDFDRTSSAAVCGEFWRQPAPRAANQESRFVFAMSAVAAIDECQIRELVGQDGDLFERLSEGVAVIGVASKTAHADDEAFVQRGGYAQFGMLQIRAYYKPTKAVEQAYPRFADPTKTVIRPVIIRHLA